jgi:hypothetical protein
MKVKRTEKGNVRITLSEDEAVRLRAVLCSSDILLNAAEISAITERFSTELYFAIGDQL